MPKMSERRTHTNLVQCLSKDFVRLLCPRVAVLALCVVPLGCGEDPSSGANAKTTNSHAPETASEATGIATDDAGNLRLAVPTLAEVEVDADAPPPRSRNEIFVEQTKLRRLYLTSKTNTRVVEDFSRGVHVHEETGEICWPALACYNPDCAGRGPNGELFAYITPDSSAYVTSTGAIAYRRTSSAKATPSEDTFLVGENPNEIYAQRPDLLGGVCPECLKTRDLANETDEDRRRYELWIRPHQFPDVAQRMRELVEERRRRIVWERANR